jgi:hypothetical protein
MGNIGKGKALWGMGMCKGMYEGEHRDCEYEDGGGKT